MSARTHTQIVQGYIEAFNARDVDAMLSMVSDDIQWLNLDGQQLMEETGDRAALGRAMRDYFASGDACTSRLSQVFATGSRVSALEVAVTPSAEGPQEQRCLSIYEFAGQLIKRVYYFPPE